MLVWLACFSMWMSLCTLNKIPSLIWLRLHRCFTHMFWPVFAWFIEQENNAFFALLSYKLNKEMSRI